MFPRHIRKCLVAFTVSVLSVGIGCSRPPATPAEIMQHSFAVGDWDVAVSMCNQLLERNPDDADIILMRGRAYLGAGDIDSAIRDFSRRIELLPEDHEGYYHRQIAYRELGRFDLAAADAGKGRRFDPLYKSAYAFDPSNFTSGIDLPTSDTPPELNFDRVSKQTTYEETIPGDEAELELDETSRVLAADESSKHEDNASKGDIGIPQAPQIVHEDLIPKLANPEAPKTADQNAGGLAELKNMQFPANPTQDDPVEQKLPDLTDPATATPAVSGLSTALPKDPRGTILVPGGAPGTMSTGLPTTPSNAAPQGLENAGPLPTGLNASQTMATGLNAPSGLNSGGLAGSSLANRGLGSSDPGGNRFRNSELDPAGLNANGFQSNGFRFDGLNAPGVAVAPTVNIGPSGFPLPNRGTGLPVPSRTASTSLTPALPAATDTPNTMNFRGNPVFGPNQKPVLANNLPGYPVPNSAANPTAPSPQPQPTISTRLSDAVLHDRLSRPTQVDTGVTSQLRSLQQP